MMTLPGRKCNGQNLSIPRIYDLSRIRILMKKFGNEKNIGYFPAKKLVLNFLKSRGTFWREKRYDRDWMISGQDCGKIFLQIGQSTSFSCPW
jgi:hypothetical protein